MSHSPLSVEKVVLNLNLSQILLFSYSPYTARWPALLKGLLAYKYSCNSLRYKDFLYILCFLLPTAQPFLSSPTFGRSGLFWQVFSLWAGDNLTHIPGFSFKTFLSQATASWLPNPKAFFSPYLLLLSLTCGLVNYAFPKPSCGLRDVTLSWFPLTSMRVTFRLVCSIFFPCVSMTCPRFSRLCSLPHSELQEGKSGDKELVRKLLPQLQWGSDSAKWQRE